MRGINKDLPTPNVAELMKLVLMIGDVRLKEELMGVAGDVYILDASVATPSHFAKFTPALVKKFLVCVQEAYPVKLKEVHVVNISPLVDTIVNFVKPFVKEKIRNRIFMHSDLNTLYEYIPREILPAEYGGDAGPLQNIHGWLKKLLYLLVIFVLSRMFLFYYEIINYKLKKNIENLKFLSIKFLRYQLQLLIIYHFLKVRSFNNFIADKLKYEYKLKLKFLILYF